MTRHITKKRVALLVAVAVAIASVVGIYAYFTATGEGSGSATVGEAATVALSSDPVGGLYPGGDDVPVTVDIENEGQGSQHLGTISGEVEDNGACDGSWFEVDSVEYDDVVAAGDTDSADTKIRMKDSGTSQDACQGKTLTIAWSSN
jgi:hypothetical protein